MTQTRASNAVTPSLPPSLTIRHAAASREALRAAFEENGPIILSVPEDAEVDISFLQLVEAARQHADTFGRSIALDRPASGKFLATLDRAGFLAQADARNTEFWLHRKD